MNIRIVTGSATTDPRCESGRGIVVAHLCNNVAAWGKGFVLAVNKVSYAPRDAYKALATERRLDQKNVLGFTSFVNVDDNIWYANMIAQRGISKTLANKSCLVDYSALGSCLNKMFNFAMRMKCDVHMPEGMGSGLAGGDKGKIHRMIKEIGEMVENAYPWLKANHGDLGVTLWEYKDVNSQSYIPQSTHPTDLTVDDL